MRRSVVVPAWLLGALLAGQVPVHAQAGDGQPPVSVERIRTALRQPPPILRAPAPSAERATFHVEVRERLSVMQPVEEPPFDPTYGLPSVGELLMNGIGKIGSAVVTYKRGRTERRARREVDDAIAAFCAAHECPAPNADK